MEIVIVCGCIEIGKDGVGDYSRLLAYGLILRGIKVQLVAVSDKYVESPKIEIQLEQCVPVNVYRIPARLSESIRTSYLKKYLDKIQPQIISFQFVPYSFQKKGLPLSFLIRLAQWKRNRSEQKWQIMFHELWLDSPKGNKQRIIAFLQKTLILMAIKALSPQVINVSIPFNQDRLRSAGFNSDVLPLFGNIPLIKNASLPATLHDEVTFKHNVLYFGAAPKEPFLTDLVDKLCYFSKNHKEQVKIIVVSGHSKDREIFVNKLRDKAEPHGTKVDDCGFVSSSEVSAIINFATIGIVRSEPHLIGKSGTAVALLEHGLPIWLPKAGPGMNFNFCFRSDLIFSDLESAAECHKKPEFHSLLFDVVDQLLSQLKML